MIVSSLQVFLTTLLIKYCHAFYNDITNYYSITGMGKARIDYKIKYAGFRLKWDGWCDYYAGKASLCDPKMDLNIFVPGEITRNFYSMFRLLEYEIFKVEKITQYTVDRWSVQGINVFFQVTYMWDNVMEIGEQKWEWDYTDNYYLTVGLCDIVIDRDIGGRNELLKMCDYTYFPYIGSSKIISGENKEERTYVKHVVAPFCSRYHYENSCWKRCEPVPMKHYCDYKGDEICEGYWENIYVGYVYNLPMPSFTSYVKQTTLTKRCRFYNPCSKRMNTQTTCPLQEYKCYPIQNNTYTCILLQIIYYASKFSFTTNASFSSMLNGETVTIYMSLTGNEKDLIRNHSYCEWEKPNNQSYDDILISDKKDAIKISISIKYGVYELKVECNIGSYHQFTFSPKYVVHILPTNLHVHNSSLSSDSYLYIGQTISCTSDAIPENISIYRIAVMDGKYKNSTKNFTHSFTIPTEIHFQNYYIICLHRFMFTDSRTPFTTLATFSYQVKSYVYFTWYKPFKNIYTIYDFAGCIHLTYFVAHTKIRQLAGPNPMATVPENNFSTYTTTGGLFRFMCKMYSEISSEIVFYKPTSLEVYYMPNFICFLPFLPSYGTLIICNHDGYPEDQINYTISLFSNRRQLYSSNKNYLKIPYTTSLKRVAIHCDIQMFIGVNISNYKIEEEIEITTKTKEEYSLSENDDLCFKYNRIPITNMIEKEENVVDFVNKILYLFSDDASRFEAWLLGIIITPYLTILFLIAIRFQVYDLRIKETRRAMRARNLNNQLISLAKLAMQGDLSNDKYFNLKMLQMTTTDDY